MHELKRDFKGNLLLLLHGDESEGLGEFSAVHVGV